MRSRSEGDGVVVVWIGMPDHSIRVPDHDSPFIAASITAICPDGRMGCSISSMLRRLLRGQMSAAWHRTSPSQGGEVGSGSHFTAHLDVGALLPLLSGYEAEDLPYVPSIKRAAWQRPRPAQHPCLARQADRCMTACANVSSTPNLGVHGDSWDQSTGWRYKTCTSAPAAPSSALVIFATFTQYHPGTPPWPGYLVRSGCCPRYSPPIDGAQPNAEQCRAMRRLRRRQSKHARSLNAECQAPATPPSGPFSP